MGPSLNARSASRVGRRASAGGRRAARALCLILALSPFCAAASDAPFNAEAAAARLHARKAETLLERYAPSAPRDQEARRELQRMALRLDRALAVTPPPPLPGLSEEAYISPIDNSAQPFHRYLPSAWKTDAAGKPPALPLIVYLHGYWSTLDLVNWAIFPDGLTNLSEQAGACVAMPFGRSNTDFQGIGEQDVLAVMDEMRTRCGTDPERVVLLGYSMGGMGAWTVGARFAERFNGLLIVCGRGDYDTWQRLEPGTLPAWERALIDAQFLSGQAPRLAGMPILAYNGANDPLVRIEEATAALALVQPHAPAAQLVVLPEGDHWIIDEVLARDDCQTWLRNALATPRASRPAPAGLRPGQTPSRLQNAFLDPFLFVQAAPRSETNDVLFARRCAEWFAFAKARPQQRHESELRAEDLATRNLFLFGEPETSPLLKRVLDSARVKVTAESFDLQGRSVPRSGRGLWLAVPSPFAPGRTVVVNCGIPWGEALPSNHCYDMLPDLLVYTAEPGRIGINVPDGAARVGDDGRFSWW